MISRSSNNGWADCKSSSSRPSISCGFFGRKDFRRGFADHLLARHSPEAFAGPVDKHVAAIAGAFDENRGRNIVDDQIEKCPVAVALLFGAALVGDVLKRGNPAAGLDWMPDHAKNPVIRPSHLRQHDLARAHFRQDRSHILLGIRQLLPRGGAPPKNVDERMSFHRLIIIAHEFAVSPIAHDNAAIGVVQAKAVSHIVERGVQLRCFLPRDRFRTLANCEQFLPLGNVFVGCHPAAAVQQLSDDANDPAVFGRPDDGVQLSFGEDFGEPIGNRFKIFKSDPLSFRSISSSRNVKPG